MKIAPKPMPGQEVSLEQLLQGPPEAPQQEAVQEEEPPKVEIPIAPTVKRPEMSILGMDGFLRLRGVGIHDGNGGISFHSIDLLKKPVLVNSYEDFLINQEIWSSGYSPNSLMGKAKRWLKVQAGWELPSGFHPANGLELWGIIESLALETQTRCYSSLLAQDLYEIFSPDVLNTGIYTRSTIRQGIANNPDFICHEEGNPQKQEICIDLSERLLPSHPTVKPTILPPPHGTVSSITFSGYCNSILGDFCASYFLKTLTKLGDNPPYFKLLTQYHETTVGSRPKAVPIPVMISTRPLDNEPTLAESEKGYVIGIRFVGGV